MKEKITQLRINGIDTDYLISNFGKVFTKKGDKQKRTEISHTGYEKVSIQIDGKAYLISVHRAVYESFVADIPERYVINHKDGNKLNNRVDNLEAVTQERNVQHAWDTGLCHKQDRVGEKNPNCKHTKNDAITVYTLLKLTDYTVNEIAEKTGMDKLFIKNIASGLWGGVTGFSKDDIRKNYKFSKEEEIIIWYLNRVYKYTGKEISEILGINKDSVNNKLGYLKRNKKEKMNKKIKKPKAELLVRECLLRHEYNDNDYLSIDFIG